MGDAPCSEGCYSSAYVAHGKTKEAYQLKFSLSTRGDLHRLHALLVRNGIVEPKERLVGLHALAIFVHNLERQFQDIGGPQRDRRGLLRQRKAERGVDE